MTPVQAEDLLLEYEAAVRVHALCADKYNLAFVKEMRATVLAALLEARGSQETSERP